MLFLFRYIRTVTKEIAVFFFERIFEVAGELYLLTFTTVQVQ